MNERAAGSRRSGRSAYLGAAICTPGLEFVCRQELLGLGLRPKPSGPGTIEFSANARQLYAANVWLRTASRVIVRLDTFRATDFAHLEAGAAKLDWSAWLDEGVAPRFRVSSNESKLYHTTAIAERLHRVVGPGLTEPARLDGRPEQLFIVRIDRNNVTISIDSSGAALNHRPWRTELGDAPLRTTMAAALLLASEWDPSTGLVDPFCGSGTIAVEAALLARAMPPGGDRSYAFQRWPDYQPGSWASVKGEIASQAKPPLTTPLLASDRDASAVAVATANAARAGVADDLSIETKVVSHLGGDKGRGLVATNPPYGRRVGDGDLTGLYRRFGSVVRERLPQWDLAIICSDKTLARAADRSLAPIARFRHGGLGVQLLHRAAPGPDGVSGRAKPGRRPGSPDRSRQPRRSTGRPDRGRR